MTYVVIGAVGVGGVLLLLLVIWSGQQMLRNPSSGSAGMDGLGGFADVFDPGRARADQDLKSKDHESEVMPSAEGKDRPAEIDHVTMKATIRMPRVSPGRPQPPKD
ncbi:hypothetical protein [Nocardioides sp. MH1]|uniref:hypothetical protein n=1 Tax=Nocardioides sp. MH1 TaxID=3242490 RepID=UPI00351F8C85